MSVICLFWLSFITLRITVCQSWRRRDFLKAICLCVYLPFHVMVGAASTESNIKIPSHSSVCYLSIFMCCTLVLNLGEYEGPDTARQDMFIAFSMVIAIPVMLYIYLFTKGHPLHDMSNISNGDSIREVDYEDVFLYISFFGNLLLTGFHLFNKIISANKPQRDNYGEELHFNVIAVDVSETFQLATQIVTLMILNHKKSHCHTASHSTDVPMHFVLISGQFRLLAPIFVFFLRSKLMRPGELFNDTATYVKIMKRMAIFYRFH